MKRRKKKEKKNIYLFSMGSLFRKTRYLKNRLSPRSNNIDYFEFLIIHRNHVTVQIR